MAFEDLLPRLGIDARERRAALLSFVYFFCILCAYYVLRPLREEMGLAGGVRNLPWMFQATLVATLMATPLFGWCVQRYERHQLLPHVYRFFGVNLLVFYGLSFWATGSTEVWLGRAFYVWLSVFNMFVVSVFWAFMADGFELGQSKRLFGFIAAGGSLGAIVGSALTSELVAVVGRLHLLLVSVALLEVAVRLIRVLHREFQVLAADRDRTTVAAMEERRAAERAQWSTRFGGSLNGIGQLLRSPYLLAIAAFLFLYSLGSTFLYFEQAHIVAEAIEGREARAALFARIDLWVNVLTLVTQVFLAGRILRWLGVGLTLVTLPLLSMVGFATLGAAPTLTVLVGFQVLRRASNYALIRPARETLFTTVATEERYKAKSFIDTFVYRGGDSLGSAGFDLLVRGGLGMGGIAFVAVPLSALWALVALYLGRKQSRIQRSRTLSPAV